MLRVFTVLSALFLLGACAATPPAHDISARQAPIDVALPPMKTFAARSQRAPARSNSAIARDFLDLSFELESGRSLPVFTRFEGPVTLRVTGRPAASLNGDLERLLTRLRNEARIPISRVPATEAAAITIEVVSRADLQRAVPQAACFVVPRVSSWDEFRRARRSSQTDWTTLTTRSRLAIFLPGDVSPQEIRDCLHEELAQALGPLNDLYRLPDSVFNDDNFHTVLTGFDMLILRATYAPELRSGMTRAEVARRLPAILARLNPGGQGRGGTLAPATPRSWINAIETALGPRTAPARRRDAARQAVEIAQANGIDDNRLAFSLFALGRLSLASEADLALSSFLQSAAIYKSRPETQLHAAHVAMQLSAFALSSGQAEAAIEIVNAHLGAVAEAENAALLSTLLLIKAEALTLAGRAAEARAVRLDSLGWARYGFGSDTEVRARVAEVVALAPRGAREDAS